jgi:hypothetical protein
MATWGHSSAGPGVRCRRATCLGALTLLAMPFATCLADSSVHVRRYAAFKEVPIANSNTSRQRTQVAVYGRTMTLVLQDNDLLGDAPISRSNLQLQRGTLEGQPDSWVRLTRSAQGINGLIWDGSELFVVDSGAAMATATAPVIYRLSDTQTSLPADYCGAVAATATVPVDGTVDGLTAYKAVVNELTTTQPTATPTGIAVLRLEMQVLTDAAYRAEFNSDDDALAALMTRINNVDGIFREQLGLAVTATNVQVLSSDPVSLSDSSDAGTLLSSLAQLRSSSAVMGTYPLTHLITGRDMDGDTLGIAYIGQLCGRKYGVSLSEVRDRGAWIDSLVLAHELGHQLGAVHDGADSCSSTSSSGYLMSSFINGSSDFSDCSKQAIRSTMSYSACLVPADMPVQTQVVSESASTAEGQSGGGALSSYFVYSLLALWLWQSRRAGLRCLRLASRKR